MQRPCGGKGRDKLEEREGGQRGWKGERGVGKRVGGSVMGRHSLVGHGRERSFYSKSEGSRGGVLCR